MTFVKNMTAAALAVALTCAGTAQAFAACWAPAEVSAAKIRDLQTRMMVAGLKCRGGGPEMLAAYNRFVVAHRGVIQQNNSVLRARFIRLDGSSGGERSYDRYTTALANNYGATDADAGACSELARLARRAASASAAELVTIAEDFGLEPEMEGGACPMRMAGSRYASKK